MIRTLRHLARDTRGITVVEFGIVAPVFGVLLMGMMDIAHSAYTRSVLDGAVQAAARSASLQNGDAATVDADIQAMIEKVAPGAVVATSRESYFDFADIDRPESWNDADNSGVCDNGEEYVDENGSGMWEADVGTNGNGGASDVIIYTVTVTYERPFAMPIVPGPAQQTMSASSIRKNQPFALQQELSTTSGTCD